MDNKFLNTDVDIQLTADRRIFPKLHLKNEFILTSREHFHIYKLLRIKKLIRFFQIVTQEEVTELRVHFKIIHSKL